jgi:hypothetical protein
MLELPIKKQLQRLSTIKEKKDHGTDLPKQMVSRSSMKVKSKQSCGVETHTGISEIDSDELAILYYVTNLILLD